MVYQISYICLEVEIYITRVKVHFLIFNYIFKELKERKESLAKRERIRNKFGFATQTKVVKFCHLGGGPDTLLKCS